MSKHAAPEVEDERPVLRIVRGNPTAQEVAALTVVLASAAAGAEPDSGPQRVAGGWGDPALRLRRTVHPGPGAWRASVWY